MGRLFLVILVLGLISACQQNTAETKPQTANRAQTATTSAPNASPAVSPSHPKNGNYDGKGIVTKINLELVSVELNHEEIKGLMPAMIMELYVKEKKELEVLKIGDKVEFVLEYKDGQEKITSIKKIQ
jgi:Cu/Ag efflux protein CusF